MMKFNTDALTVERNERTVSLIGEEAFCRLAKARVLIAGIGGVGGYALEVLARSGVGNFVIIDSDVVAMSNVNRQLIADVNTVGKSKTRLWEERIAAINPEAEVIALEMRLTAENTADFLENYRPDFVVDAIDSVAPKCALIMTAGNMKIPIISSMGAGGRLDPAEVKFADLWGTSEDGLARAVRTRLKKAGFRHRVPVVWSREAPRRRALISVNEPNKVSSFGTLATVPATFGIFMASYVIRKLIEL